MKTLLLSLVAGSLLAASPAQAGSWIFQPSYYTHAESPGVRIGVAPAPHAPRVTRPHGAYYRSGLRRLNSSIVVRGRTVDQLLIWDGWFQTGEQH